MEKSRLQETSAPRKRKIANFDSATAMLRALASHLKEPLVRDWLISGATAAVFSGMPSTVHSLLGGGDLAEAMRAAGAMLIAAESNDIRLFFAAAVVHTTTSFFWAAILVAVLPRKHVAVWSVIAATLIGVLDLRVIAPLFFPEVARLAFLPQMADHIVWGLCVGLVLRYRWRQLNDG